MFRYLLAFVLLFCVASSAEATNRRFRRPQQQQSQHHNNDFNNGFQAGVKAAQRQQLNGHHVHQQPQLRLRVPFVRFSF